MSSKPRRPGQGSIKEFRRSVATLKRSGLVSKHVDARSQEPTRYMRGVVKKFNDVLTGRAAVVKAPSRAVAKEYGETFRTKGRAVVVPVEKNERLRYSLKENAIIGTRPGYSDGERVEKIYTRSGDLPEHPPANHVYSIPLGMSVRSFDTLSDAVLFMQPYETGPHKYHGSLGDWRKYLYIERYSSADDANEYAE